MIVYDHSDAAGTIRSSIRNSATSCLLALCLAFGTAACSGPGQDIARRADESDVRQTVFRVRSGFNAGLNADVGWAGRLNQNVTVNTDEPFRIRFEVETSPDASDVQRFRLQYRHNGGAWMNVAAADFPYWESAAAAESPDAEEATPRISVVSTGAYENGATTTDLLAGSVLPYQDGAGVSLRTIGPSWSAAGAQSEWEWPLVIRRYADGAVTNEEGDTFELRMADAGGCPLASAVTPVVTVSVPPNHLGGTFVETPGRIGPWEASNGDLYFIMEPGETYNVMMVVKSTDGGETWQEVDGKNRPRTGDLEGFATDLSGNTIHMLHQTSDEVLHHTFRTSDHPTAPDTWVIRDDTVATPGEPPTQVAAMAVRSDGSIVGVYGGPEKIHFRIRSTNGLWGDETVIDEAVAPNLSGPQATLGEGDAIHLAYTGADGTAWYRRIMPDGSVTPREQLASDLGTSEADVGSILPLVFVAETNTAVVIYRTKSGMLWERRIIDHASPTAPTRVTDRAVVQNAVDSDQTGADAIADGGSVHVLFIDQESGNIFHTYAGSEREWRPAALVVDGIRGQWVRGSLLARSDGRHVYGYVYDAGSNGGSGMNRFGTLPLGGR